MTESETNSVSAFYEPLKDEAVWTHAKWQVWRGLYGNRGRIEILKASASGFFSILQPVLFDDILMALSRLTDARGAGKRTNLTLDHLGEHLVTVGLSAAATEFEVILKRMREECAEIREIRSKLLGHRDLTAALSGGAGLSTVRVPKVDAALDDLAGAMNLFERALGIPVWMYKQFIHTDSFNRLLSQLKKGLAYDTHAQSGLIPKGTDDLTLPKLDV
jgi:hypothetical protein